MNAPQAQAAGCGAPAGGAALAGVDVGTQAVITGVVRRDEGAGPAPVAGAYVRLLDRTGEFTAEVRTEDDGVYRFFAAPGTWTVRALASGGATAEGTAQAATGSIAQVDLVAARSSAPSASSAP